MKEREIKINKPAADLAPVDARQTELGEAFQGRWAGLVVCAREGVRLLAACLSFWPVCCKFRSSRDKFHLLRSSSISDM